MVVLVLTTGAIAYYGWTRLSALEGELNVLRDDLAETSRLADAEGRRADQAETEAQNQRSRAELAERRADEEASERAVAEDARLAAEAEADFSQQRATVAEIEAEAARAEAQRIRDERDREMSRLQEALGRVADTQRTALGLVMNLGEDTINFEYDKADLAPEDREILSRIAGVLLTASGYRIQVYGHTDDVGSQDYNLGLSERRAEAVAAYLASAGVPREIMTVKGFGKAKPLAEGVSDADRARNRRVELGIIDTVVNYTTEVPEDARR